MFVKKNGWANRQMEASGGLNLIKRFFLKKKKNLFDESSEIHNSVSEIMSSS